MKYLGYGLAAAGGFIMVVNTIVCLLERREEKKTVKVSPVVQTRPGFFELVEPVTIQPGDGLFFDHVARTIHVQRARQNAQ